MSEAQVAEQAVGHIVQVIGPVIDVAFPRGQVPEIMEAIVVEDRHLTIEVQTQLGDGVARGIA